MLKIEKDLVIFIQPNFVNIFKIIKNVLKAISVVIHIHVLRYFIIFTKQLYRNDTYKTKFCSHYPNNIPLC